MTEEEIEEKAKKYSFEKVCKECGYSFSCSDKNSLCSKLKNSLRIYQDGFNDGYSDGYEVGKKNERELQCGKNYIEGLRKRIHSLEAENESLRKSGIVWHEITCEDDPDNAGRYLLENNPGEEDKEYLLKTKHGFAIDTLDYGDTGFFFQDYDWSELEAWAELPEVTVLLM